MRPGTTDTLKHVVESLGVPHTEIARATRERCACPVLDSRLHEDDRVDVFPYGEPVLLKEYSIRSGWSPGKTGGIPPDARLRYVV